MKGLEIELKFLLDAAKRRSLRDLQCIKPRIYQRTVMFDNDAQLMDKTNGRLRLRQTGSEVSLSYKKPLPSEVVKKEIEWETRINDWESGKKLLEAMGFQQTTSYEKYRTTFDYNGLNIEIDEYPFATFIEIEGIETAAKRAALELGFNLEEALLKPCDTLFTEWRAAKGLPMKSHMRFADFNQ